MSSPGDWKPNMKQTYGDSPHDLLPNHVEQTETVASAATKNLLNMIYCTDTHRPGVCANSLVQVHASGTLWSSTVSLGR